MDISELLTYTETEFGDLTELVAQLNNTLSLTRESLDGMLNDPNSHLYVVRESGRIVGCAALCIFHQPFQTDGNIESVVVSSACRGRGYGRALVDHLISEARKTGPITLHLTSSPGRIAANGLYRAAGFTQKQTNVYVMTLE